jgi:hypothetical protein
METIFIIFRELEYLEDLVKLKATQTRVVVMDTFTIRQVCINKIHHIKILHLVVEINQTLIESLVDINASMSIMATNVVREFGIMHLVLGHEMYKTMSRIITQALGRITDILVTNCKVVCQMIFLVVNTNNYYLPLE